MLRSISKQSGESVISLLYGICYVLVVSHYAEIIDPVCHVCGACKVCEAVCLSVCPSVPSSGRHTPLRRVCCCGPGGQEISIDCCIAGAHQQMRTVSRCQLT